MAVYPSRRGERGPQGDTGQPRAVQDEGVSLPARDAIDFVGAGVTAVDDLANDRTVVTIPGATATPGHVIADETVALPPEPILDFQGAGVVATNGAGRTVVTIPGAAPVGLNDITDVDTSGTVTGDVLTDTGVPGPSRFSMLPPPAGPTAGHVIEDETVPLPQRAFLDFQGAGVVATDGGTKTIVTIPGPPTAGHTIADEGVNQSQQPILDFIGAGVTAASVAGRTTVTIPGAVGAAGHVIEDEGTPLAQQPLLNFVGAGVIAANGAGVTTVTIPGPSAPSFVSIAKWGID